MTNLQRYDQLLAEPSVAPPHWATACTHKECSLHQLSPYIGKLKSTIARDLVAHYSKPGDLVVDPFCGSGTVPLEAACLGRRVLASDASTYATTLTNGKLAAPESLSAAHQDLARVLQDVERLPLPDLRRVPKWVRSFFHPLTLKETLRLARFLRQTERYFLLSCLLGILHHQRPGFLSYPSSNLVPYLRTKKFPRDDYPHLYEYRPLAERLRAKVTRAFKRPPPRSPKAMVNRVTTSLAEDLPFPESPDCVVTSPPYMNALDYVRDNRLRLWFLGGHYFKAQDRATTSLAAFQCAIASLATQVQRRMTAGTYCVFVVGEKVKRDRDRFPSRVLAAAFLDHAPSFRLTNIVSDFIPDVRRARRELAGVKRENVLIFQRR